MFESNIINIYGKKGQQWLEDLPSLVAKIEAEYGLSNLKPVEALSYNYVLSGFQGPQPIILKLGLDIDGFKREAAALMAFEGFGVVQIFSENTGLLILECAVPGVSLKSHFPENDDDAINITANVIKRLHKAPIPSTHAFPHIKDWLAVLDSDLEIPLQTLQKSREIRDQLLRTAIPDVFLHGDLHHDNILQNGGLVYEELAEIYFAKRSGEQSQKYARLAHEDLSKDAWMKKLYPKRIERLLELGKL